MDHSLSVTDNRTGEFASIPVNDGAIRALDLRHLKEKSDDFGLMTYDPAFLNTAPAVAPSRTSTATRYPALPWLPHRGPCRALQFPRGGLADAQRGTTRPNLSA